MKYQVTVKVGDTTHGISRQFEDDVTDEYAFMFLKIQLLKRLEKTLSFENKKY